MTTQHTTDPTDAEAGEILEQIEADDQQQPENTPETSEETAAAEEPPEDTPGRSKAARDAAKYRTQLREVEAQRDAYAEQLETVQRQVIDAHIEKHGLSPALLWRTGLETREVLDEDGRVSPDRVRAACDTVRTEFGIPRSSFDPAQQAEDQGVEQKASQLFKGPA